MTADEIIINAEKSCRKYFDEIDDVAFFNQNKVLNAFIDCRVSGMHFNPSNGYGYNDSSKYKLSEVFARALGADYAYVSPHFASGTHTISCALLGIFKPGDAILCITGMPYDTLQGIIFGDNIGSLKDNNISFDIVNLKNGDFDSEKIISCLKNKKYSGIYIQRSPGYEKRASITISMTKKIIDKIKDICSVPILVDNCYGEFVDKYEPTDVGADLIMGSLIKNPGGSLAPTGGYIAGKKNLVQKSVMRLTAPGIGEEIGSYEQSYRSFFQGLFIAPHVVSQARKGGVLIAKSMELIGYSVFPPSDCKSGDIVRIIDFNDKDKMISFCQNIQASSPIDSFARPIPGEMPGYNDDIIMASGSFIQGSSIELSADAPVRPPYSLYVQGGITFEHTKIALKKCLESIV